MANNPRKGKPWAQRETEREARREPVREAYLQAIMKQKAEVDAAEERERASRPLKAKSRMSKSQAKRAAAAKKRLEEG